MKSGFALVPGDRAREGLLYIRSKPRLVANDLQLYGPTASSTAGIPNRNAAEAYCRQLATTHYENFPIVSWLLPKGLHQHFYNVYAYCRWADDLGDEVGDPARSLELLAWWRGELATWITTDAGYVAAYLGLLGGFLHPLGFAIAGLGALVFCVGHGWHAGSLRAALVASAELLERLLQILINTLSFARVGAFALAHAWLSSAIVALMDAADSFATSSPSLSWRNFIAFSGWTPASSGTPSTWDGVAGTMPG